MCDSPKKVDRYGWYSPDDHVKSNAEKKLEEEESKKEPAREAKWAEMVSKWDYWITNKRDKIAERIKKGIPDAFRSKAWELLTSARNSLNAAPESMEGLLKKPPLPVYETIKIDLMSTLSQTAFFSKPELLTSLEHVLCAYSQIDPEIGYTQGMSYIAGTFLMYMDEEIALWAFYNTLVGFRTLHREYFTPGSPRTKLATKMLKELVKMHYPKIYAHLEQIEIDFELFTHKWFIPAFLSYNWPPEMHLRLFDVFLFYGTRALLSFALIIFSRHKDMLDSKPAEEIIPLLQYPDRSDRMKDWRYVFTKFNKLWVNKKLYQTLLKNAGAPPERLE
jgi:hypothetical protein